MTLPSRALARLRDVGRQIALRWPGIGRTAAPEGSRRRAFIARLTRPPLPPGPALMSPMSHDPEVTDIGFASPAEPLVSVVVPVFRKLGLTLRCLAALSAADLADTFEVIVVDDASDDGTAGALREATGITVVEMPENVGYLRATNAGIAAASGEFVLLLNNDVEVHPHALRALVDALRRNPTAGAAGARLIYADGSLQEAGSIIWSDGSGWNYGKGADPRSPEFAYVRPVDYCSAACLLVRRSALGAGFDERYAPAYYEDSDLAFTLRAAGLDTIYVPGALALHHEGASHGTSVRTGVKAFQERNRELFREKWESALKDQHAASVEAVLAARDRRNGPRILVPAGRSPSAGELAADATRQGAVVTLVVSDGALPDERVDSLREAGVEVWEDSAPSLARHIRSLSPHLHAVVVTDSAGPPTWVRRSVGNSVPVLDGLPPSGSPVR